MSLQNTWFWKTMWSVSRKTTELHGIENLLLKHLHTDWLDLKIRVKTPEWKVHGPHRFQGKKKKKKTTQQTKKQNKTANMEKRKVYGPQVRGLTYSSWNICCRARNQLECSTGPIHSRSHVRDLRLPYYTSTGRHRTGILHPAYQHQWESAAPRLGLTAGQATAPGHQAGLCFWDPQDIS